MEGTPRTPRVAIVGAGMSGIGMGAKLTLAGIRSFRIYEKRDGFGGTWRANTYPGLYCDVPSRHYQFTFDPNGSWSQLFPAGPEINAYFERVAERFRLAENTSFGTGVDEAVWQDGEWVVRDSRGGEARYDFLVTATGVLSQPRKAAIPGLEDFDGASFHSAEWDHSVQCRGARVAVIGTGSTGMQITRGLAGVAGHYELYQRTPQWILPLPNRENRWTGPLTRRFPEATMLSYRYWRWALEKTAGTAVVSEGWQRRLIAWICRKHLETVSDPELRRRFTPPDQPMCKRMIMGNGFYPLFERDDVDLVDTPIERVEEDGIRTSDGVLHPQDVIVLATGFHAHRLMRPMEMIGLGGRRLSDLWSEREPFGYRTVAVPGFPNAFTLMGPHSPFGNQSLTEIAETQIDFAMQAIGAWRRREIGWLAPTDAAAERFNDEMRAQVPNTVWTTGCDSWYLGADGLPSLWPWLGSRHVQALARIEPEDWEFGPVEPIGNRDPALV